MVDTFLFSDLDNQLGEGKTPLLVYDEEAINVSIENILGTSPGSRWFRPTFGGPLRRFLFYPITETTATAILMASKNAIERWENRVRVLIQQSSVIPNYDEQSYTVNIVYEYDQDKIGEYSATLRKPQ